jgi:hypothetical protein
MPHFLSGIAVKLASNLWSAEECEQGAECHAVGQALDFSMDGVRQAGCGPLLPRENGWLARNLDKIGASCQRATGLSHRVPAPIQPCWHLNTIDTGFLPMTDNVRQHPPSRLKSFLRRGLAIAALGAGLYLILNFSQFLGGYFDTPKDGQPLSYALLFIAGTLTGFHCAGMCGALVVGYTVKAAAEGGSKYLTHLYYGVGKTLSYTVIGGLFGALGAIVTFTPFMRGVAGSRGVPASVRPVDFAHLRAAGPVSSEDPRVHHALAGRGLAAVQQPFRDRLAERADDHLRPPAGHVHHGGRHR